jgi:anti-sigma B factor antagonist
MAILSERLEYSAEAHGVGDPEVVIEVHGDVDLISAPGLSILIFEVARWGPERLVLDLSDVGVFGSDGVRALATARRRLLSEVELVVRSPSPLSRRVLEATGTQEFCRIED